MNSGQQAEPHRILIRGVNWLGDAVMTTPALQRLREKHPQAHIALLTHEKLAELWRGQSVVGSVITFATGERPWGIGKRLRAHKFDTALVFPNSPRSALEVWAAAIPRRLGFANGWRRWFLNEIVARRPGAEAMGKRSVREIKRLVSSEATSVREAPTLRSTAHQMHHYLWLAAALGASAEPTAPRLELRRSDVADARGKWFGGTGPVLLGINPGAAYGPAKRWPIENFAQVSREVAQAVPGVTWVAIGSREERELCDSLQRVVGGSFVNLAGETSLRELMAVLSLCQVLVTNDSGPMHVAAALGTPVVVPFGSTSPELTGPGLLGASAQALFRSAAACSPCFRRECPIDFRCMLGISVQQVSSAVLGILQKRMFQASAASSAQATRQML